MRPWLRESMYRTQARPTQRPWQAAGWVIRVDGRRVWLSTMRHRWFWLAGEARCQVGQWVTLSVGSDGDVHAVAVDATMGSRTFDEVG